ncbi:heparan-alpha-glucosaminide N-acetyltransferase domain-containing protein [Ketobacter sp.]
MTDRKDYFPGLNIYRAIAVLLMMLAHSARVQTSTPLIMAHPEHAGWLDWPLLSALYIEPIISAMFLFIAGFSLVLSRTRSRESKSGWLIRLGKRMFTLYAISVIFFIADQGFQIPDLFLSSGVLAIIAVGILSAGVILVTPHPWIGLLSLSVAVESAALYLEQQNLSIVGLNAGAGGMVPLVLFAYSGALSGMLWQSLSWKGLWLLLGLSLPVAIWALASDLPWVTHPVSQIHYYPGNRLSSVWYSLQDAFGLYHGPDRTGSVRYWNHAAVFVCRALPLLVAGLMVALHFKASSRHPLLKMLNRPLDWMGRNALNLYILHLVLLAMVEVSTLKPAQGWQTLLLLAVILSMSAWALRYISFVPLRRIKKRAPQEEAL